MNSDMTRRGFVFAAACAVGGVACGATARPKPKLGVQLYSVRDYVAANGFARTFAELKKLGYAGVEFAGYRDVTSPNADLKPELLGRMLRDAGLVACGTHTTAVLPHEIERTAAYNLALGNRYLMSPFQKPPKEEKDPAGWWKARGEAFSKSAEIARRLGCRIGYHNHLHEFEKIGRTCPWEIFFSAAAPEVCMQADVGHMVRAHEDPVGWLKRFPNRALTLHLSNWDNLPMPAIAATVAQDITEWYIVEDGSKPDRLDNVARGVKVFANYIA